MKTLTNVVIDCVHAGIQHMRLVYQRYLLFAGATVTVAAASVVYAVASVWGQKSSKELLPSAPKRILITGAAGQIAYALAPLIASGQMLGPEQPVILQLYDVQAAHELLQGLQAELEDSLAAYPLLQGVLASTDFPAACQGVSVAVLCGGVPRRGQALTKAELMAANCAIYRDQAAALAAHAALGVKVVVVASPANTNAWVLQQSAPSIPAQDITALTRLDHNRALQHLSAVLGVHASEVTNVIVWGNHASSQFPYGHLAKLRGQPILQLYQHQEQQQQLPLRQQGLDGTDLDDYLRNEFITIVQNRGAHISRLRVQLSPALSAAAAICNHVHDWLLGTPPGDYVSMGVSSDGSYGIAAGLVYSFPVHCNHGHWSIVKGLPIEAWAWARMKISEADLLEEQTLALKVLAAAAAAAAAGSAAADATTTVEHDTTSSSNATTQVPAVQSTAAGSAAAMPAVAALLSVGSVVAAAAAEVSEGAGVAVGAVSTTAASAAGSDGAAAGSSVAAEAAAARAAVGGSAAGSVAAVESSEASPPVGQQDGEQARLVTEQQQQQQQAEPAQYDAGIASGQTQQEQA